MSEHPRELHFVVNIDSGLPRGFGGDDQGRSRAARRASVSYRQIAGLYYDQVKDPKFSVASSVLSAAEQARIEATRKEASVLASRFAVTAEG